jgi:hypothetical protein
MKKNTPEQTKGDVNKLFGGCQEKNGAARLSGASRFLGTFSH